MKLKGVNICEIVKPNATLFSNKRDFPKTKRYLLQPFPLPGDT